MSFQLAAISIVLKTEKPEEPKMVDVGQQAPDFSLPAKYGTTVTLSQYRGKKNVVLSVHIFSFTGG